MWSALRVFSTCSPLRQRGKGQEVVWVTVSVIIWVTLEKVVRHKNEFRRRLRLFKSVNKGFQQLGGSSRSICLLDIIFKLIDWKPLVNIALMQHLAQQLTNKQYNIFIFKVMAKLSIWVDKHIKYISLEWLNIGMISYLIFHHFYK